MPTVSRIAIVNRGEAAMRLIHAVRDLNARHTSGSEQIRTIALHTDVVATITVSCSTRWPSAVSITRPAATSASVTRGVVPAMMMFSAAQP